MARPRNLVRHLALWHAGQQLGERGAAVLCGLDQGICGGCSCIRSFRSHACLHCPLPMPPPRPAMADDKITVPQVHAPRPGRQQPQERQPAVLPSDWTGRVRALPGQTLPHVPSCVREASAVAMAQSLEALLADGPDRDIEQGRAKLLLAPPPKGFTFALKSRGVASFGAMGSSKPCWFVPRPKQPSGKEVVGVMSMIQRAGGGGPDN